MDIKELLTSLGAMAEMLWAFNTQLRKIGFPRDEASRLTEVFLKETLNKNKEAN